jgi:hypothetical protein
MNLTDPLRCWGLCTCYRSKWANAYNGPMCAQPHSVGRLHFALATARRGTALRGTALRGTALRGRPGTMQHPVFEYHARLDAPNGGWDDPTTDACTDTLDVEEIFANAERELLSLVRVRGCREGEGVAHNVGGASSRDCIPRRRRRTAAGMRGVEPKKKIWTRWSRLRRCRSRALRGAPGPRRALPRRA